MKLDLDNLPTSCEEANAHLFKLSDAEEIAEQLTVSKVNNSFEVDDIESGDAFIRVLDSEYDFIGWLTVNPVLEN